MQIDMNKLAIEISEKMKLLKRCYSSKRKKIGYFLDQISHVMAEKERVSSVSRKEVKEENNIVILSSSESKNDESKGEERKGEERKEEEKKEKERKGEENKNNNSYLTKLRKRSSQNLNEKNLKIMSGSRHNKAENLIKREKYNQKNRNKNQNKEEIHLKINPTKSTESPEIQIYERKRNREDRISVSLVHIPTQDFSYVLKEFVIRQIKKIDKPVKYKRSD